MRALASRLFPLVSILAGDADLMMEPEATSADDPFPNCSTNSPAPAAVEEAHDVLATMPG